MTSETAETTDPHSADYSSIVVGSDGSQSSMLAVRRAARLAAAFDAQLLIACAYYEPGHVAGPQEPLSDHPVVGAEQAEAILEPAVEEARALGAEKVSSAVQTGSPVAALMSIVAQHDADVLVVGNRGINTLTGRLLGSVPADIARQSDCDVIIVHTVA
ncbi:universal stress protein [Corynebacterium propinquum]|uniref:universal stress protein n=1 Tax=Corynebacterium propinquum TaxID=43769 RepID=UPI0020BDC7E6|nr:universal stress protein [Corynebacterium propinquum]MDK4252216.1 universal stress protein [Corynebacterium propinquum]MDK8536073.1 universal stress protein [Corynebacterium propinquum]UQV61172.1 universal stress protein [Corynebacterium propinquum]WKS27004.1 universal stress protein [Corynebacterium propinquum]